MFGWSFNSEKGLNFDLYTSYVLWTMYKSVGDEESLLKDLKERRLMRRSQLSKFQDNTEKTEDSMKNKVPSVDFDNHAFK